MAIRIWRVIQQTFTRFSSNDGITLAAATAYYAAFSFFPLLYVLITALGLALSVSESAQDARQQLIKILTERTVPAFTEEVERILADVELHAPRNAFLGGIILLFGAIGIFSQMEFAFDRLWHDPTRPDHGIRAAIVNALWNRLKAFLTLLALGVLLLVIFVADLLLSVVHTWTDQLADGTPLWNLVQVGFSLVLNAVVLALVYRLMPRRKVRWLHAACGGVFVAVVWQGGSQVLSRVMLSGGYSAYGVVGSFIAVMLWIYCASVLLYLGGQLVQVLGNPYNSSQPAAVTNP